jgi:hypothetical protein
MTAQQDMLLLAVHAHSMFPALLLTVSGLPAAHSLHQCRCIQTARAQTTQIRPLQVPNRQLVHRMHMHYIRTQLLLAY